MGYGSMTLRIPGFILHYNSNALGIYLGPPGKAVLFKAQIIQNKATSLPIPPFIIEERNIGCFYTIS